MKDAGVRQFRRLRRERLGARTVQGHTLRFNVLGARPIHVDLHGMNVVRLSRLHRGALDGFLQLPPTGMRLDISPFGDELHIVVVWSGPF
jgi:hypothetical protein